MKAPALFVLTAFCMSLLLDGCRKKEDDYYFEPASFFPVPGVDTLVAGTQRTIMLRVSNPEYGGQALLDRISQDYRSLHLRALARYQYGYGYEDTPETKDVACTLRPTRKGYYYLYLEQSGAPELVDTFFVQ